MAVLSATSRMLAFQLHCPAIHSSVPDSAHLITVPSQISYYGRRFSASKLDHPSRGLTPFGRRLSDNLRAHFQSTEGTDSESSGSVNSIRSDPHDSSELDSIVQLPTAPDIVRTLALQMFSVLRSCSSAANMENSFKGGEMPIADDSEGGGEGKTVAHSKMLLSCSFITSGIVATSGLSWQGSPALHDSLAGVITLCGALGFLQFFNELAKRDVLDKRLSRKLVHIMVGLGFMLFWPLFTMAPRARYLAAFAPAANAVRMLLVGSGVLNNEAIVKAMSRGGDRRELLKGPFYYAVAVVVTTVGFWRGSPVGIVALVNLCAGDGFADIIGRNFGRAKLPYNKDKSYAGTIGFFVMSSLASVLYLKYFAMFGFLDIVPGTLSRVLLVSFVTALVESIPISTQLDDNFTVPFTAITTGMLLFPRP